MRRGGGSAVECLVDDAVGARTEQLDELVTLLNDTVNEPGDGVGGAGHRS